MTSQIFKKLLVLWIILNVLSFTVGGETHSSDTYQLEIKLEGIMVKKGVFHVAHYNSEKNFEKKAYLTKQVAIDEYSKSIIFANLPEGEYAVLLYQDLNSNGRLDKLLSVPLEPYGVSNNMNGFPSFDGAKFKLTNNKILLIKIKN